MSKSETNPKSEKSNRWRKKEHCFSDKAAAVFLFWIFEFVSDFDIRISDFRGQAARISGFRG